uniref:Molybdate-anion transporter n=1 Tax=Setaria digitata TaxID=48799 RepID=A0A915PIJ7_9BILA
MVDVDDYCKKYDQMSEEMLPKCSLLPGALKLLRHLKAHSIPMAICTDSTKMEFELKTRNHKELLDLVSLRVYEFDECLPSTFSIMLTFVEITAIMTCFYVLGVICIIQYFYAKSKNAGIENATFHRLQHYYLLVYLLAVAGDWLQGSHVYVLYDSYGMTKHEIELLFVAGFGSSLLFGTFIASIADKYGRRSGCLLYAVLYASACFTKHFANFWILIIGRIFGGISTSILYSAFESWLVSEHSKMGFSPDLLKATFSHAALGNSIVAIICGLVSQYAADAFGYVTPFDISLAMLVIMAICAAIFWTENYGSKKTDLNRQFMDAYSAICVGIFWPAMGFMRGIYIPEATRATVMNFCRVPLNGIVIIILLQNLTHQTIFQCCVVFLTFATAAQQYLYRIRIDEGKLEAQLAMTDITIMAQRNPISPASANQPSDSYYPPQSVQ